MEATGNILGARLVVEKIPAVWRGMYASGRICTSDFATLPETPPRYDWSAMMKQLRTGDFAGDAGKANAARLPESCGYFPVVKMLRKEYRHFMPIHVTPKILARISALKSVVRVLDKEGFDAIRDVRDYRADLQSAVKKELSPRPHVKITGPMLETWLRREGVKIPPVNTPSRDVKMHEAFAHAVQRRKMRSETFEQATQRARIEILGKALASRCKAEYPESPYPDMSQAATKHLLDFAAGDIHARFNFDADGMAVVSLTPAEPLAALVLAAHEQATLSKSLLCQNPRCKTKAFHAERTRAFCTTACADYVKKAKGRKIDEALTEWQALNAAQCSGQERSAWVAVRATELATVLAGGPIRVTEDDVKRRQHNA